MTVGVVLVAGLLVALVWLSIQVWLAVFAGILLAVFFRTLSTLVARAAGLPQVWSLALVILLLLGLGTLGGWLLAPSLADQAHELEIRLPAAIDKISAKWDRAKLGDYLPRRLPPAGELASGAGKVLGNAAAFFKVSVQAIADFLVILFLGVYLAAAPGVYLEGLVRLFPLERRPRVREVQERVGVTLGHWLVGQLVSMATVGTLIGAGLGLLKVPLALALGVLAGLLNFIPIAGSLLSAVPAVLLAFLAGPWHPLYVIGLYLLVNIGIESHILVPLIQRYAISMPPAVAVLALFVMGELFGFFGLLLAVPFTATLIVLIKTLYVGDVLGDKPEKSAPPG